MKIGNQLLSGALGALALTGVVLSLGFVLEPELMQELLSAAVGRTPPAPALRAAFVPVPDARVRPKGPATAAKASDETDRERAPEAVRATVGESLEQLRARLQLEQQARGAELARREEQARDLARKRMVEDQINSHALSAARRNVSVTMYSTVWCGACKAARSYMDRQQIAYTDHDVDRDAAARERARQLNPRGSVPTIDVDGSVMVGFSHKTLEAKIDASARKRARL